MADATAEATLEGPMEIYDDKDTFEDLAIKLGKRMRDGDDVGDKEEESWTSPKRRRIQAEAQSREEQQEAQTQLQSLHKAQQEGHTRLRAIQKRLAALVTSLGEEATDDQTEEAKAASEQASALLKEAQGLNVAAAKRVELANKLLGQGSPAKPTRSPTPAQRIFAAHKDMEAIAAEVQDLGLKVRRRYNDVRRLEEKKERQKKKKKEKARKQAEKKRIETAKRKAQEEEDPEDEEDDEEDDDDQGSKSRKRAQERQGQVQGTQEAEWKKHLQARRAMEATRKRTAELEKKKDQEQQANQRAEKTKQSKLKQARNSRAQNGKALVVSTLLKAFIPLFRGMKQHAGTADRMEGQQGSASRVPTKVAVYSAGKDAKERIVDCCVSSRVYPNKPSPLTIRTVP